MVGEKARRMAPKIKVGLVMIVGLLLYSTIEIGWMLLLLVFGVLDVYFISRRCRQKANNALSLRFPAKPTKMHLRSMSLDGNSTDRQYRILHM
jgi:hypothetical protein